MPTLKYTAERGGELAGFKVLGVPFVAQVGKRRCSWCVFRCRCGRPFAAPVVSVGRGSLLSCGCARSSQGGDSTSRLYFVWRAMRGRCNDGRCRNYRYYGARGIRVCKEWDGSYQHFREWALANGYADGLEIDRRDNNGNYEPSNCRWVTHAENMRNRGR